MIKTLAFLTRKPGMSRAQFLERYEAVHALLGKAVMPTAKRYLRRYVRPVEENFPFPDFDVITEVWFEDRQAHAEAMAFLASPDVAKRVVEDEEQQFDRSKSVFATVEECETKLPHAASTAASTSGADGDKTKFLAFLERKSGMSREDFIRYYETKHAPFAATYMSQAARYFRRFLNPIPSPIDGAAPAPDFHVVTEIWFDSDSRLREFLVTAGTAETAALFATDEENLFDRCTMKFAIVDERETKM